MGITVRDRQLKVLEACDRVNAARKREQYQPKTGQSCSCRKGQQRDNCSSCEGTGMVIDFAAIRARTTK